MVETALVAAINSSCCEEQRFSGVGNRVAAVALVTLQKIAAMPRMMTIDMKIDMSTDMDMNMR